MRSVAILGGQWGDEGKGKIIDWAAGNFQLCARATGGNNAGHTIYINKEKYVFHLIPSAITWENVDCILGNGMVIDPLFLLKEISVLKEKGYKVNNLYISGKAHVILLYHRILDKYQETKDKKNKSIGTTLRGIGPSYTDKTSRTGIRINDLLNRDILYNKIKQNLTNKFILFKYAHEVDDADIINDLINSIPEEKFFSNYKEKLNTALQTLDKSNLIDVFTDFYLDIGKELLLYITDIDAKITYESKKGKSILLEGAQGLLLDIDHGTYPFVTSSNPSIGGIKTGLGINHIDEVYSVLKAYITRVGNGAFPTELKDETGNYIREKGQEYGSTTGRPRRCGWHDAVLTRHTSRINGKKVIITKIDVLTGLKTIKICNSYKYLGSKRVYNGEIYFSGKIIRDFPADNFILEYCIPHEVIELEGWTEGISNIKKYNELPIQVKNYIKKIEELGNVEACIIGVGHERDQTIVIDNKWLNMMENTSEKKLRYKAVIYDMDNTLVATDQYIIDLIKKTTSELKQEIDFRIPNDDEIVSVLRKNLPFEDIFKNLFPNPEDYNKEEQFWSLILTKYRDKAKNTPYKSTKNSVETVKSLNQRGIIQGIVTNRANMIKERLEQAGYPEFNFMLSPSLPEYKKPNPHAFDEALLILEKQGIKKQEILSLGDHPDDYIASRDAGLNFMAVLTGSSSKEDFIKLGLNEKDIIETIDNIENDNLENYF